jgi:hypothetical protein
LALLRYVEGAIRLAGLFANRFSTQQWLDAINYLQVFFSPKIKQRFLRE